MISAARQEQPANWLSVPVTVITAEDIHYSGARTIPEVLQFAPGLDVLRVERDRYAIGVRGLHDTIADRTLTLVDGRAADSPHFGGSEFYRLPVFLEDIKRIEVLRGPGGAAWGANAFTGVINIITKEPEECLGWLGQVSVTHFGDIFSHARWAAKEGKWSWMTSVGYADIKSSERAMDSPVYETWAPPIEQALMGYGGYEARDYTHGFMFDGKAVYRISDQSKASLGLAVSSSTFGDYEFGGYYARDGGAQHSYRPFARIDTKFDDDSSGYLQYFGKFERMNSPPSAVIETRENDWEAQYSFRPADKHRATVGGNFRWINLDYSFYDDEQLHYAGEPYNEFWAGLFVMDRWDVTDRLVLEAQLRGDWYSQTQTDWSGRLSAMYAVDPAKRHILRLSGAKAFRAPLTSLRETETHRIYLPLPSPPFPPDLYGFNVLPPDHHLMNEETTSIELGYTGRLSKHLTLRVDGYYQRFERLIGYRTLDDPLLLGRGFYAPDNIGPANGFGAETELVLEGKPGKLAVWYAYNVVDPEYDKQSTRSYLPARHKAGLTGRLRLPHDVTLNVNYKFADTTPMPTQTPEGDRFHQLDIAVAKEVFKGAGEVMIGVQDVLNGERGPDFATGQLTAHETPGRTFFVRLQVRF